MYSSNSCILFSIFVQYFYNIFLRFSIIYIYKRNCYFRKIWSFHFYDTPSLLHQHLFIKPTVLKIIIDLIKIIKIIYKSTGRKDKRINNSILEILKFISFMLQTMTDKFSTIEIR